MPYGHIKKQQSKEVLHAVPEVVGTLELSPSSRFI